MRYKIYNVPTLFDLMTVLNEMHERGDNLNRKWNGFDDELVYCHDGDGEWIAFDPNKGYTE